MLRREGVPRIVVRAEEVGEIFPPTRAARVAAKLMVRRRPPLAGTTSPATAWYLTATELLPAYRAVRGYPPLLTYWQSTHHHRMFTAFFH